MDNFTKEFETAENSSEPQNLKRKRPPSKNGSDEEDSGSDEGEYKLFTKYFVSTGDKTKKELIASNVETENSQASTKPSQSRKRKFLYKTDALEPKKYRKFYFLSEFMTKPRKPKLSKPPEVEEKQQLQPVFGKKHKLHFARVDVNGNVYLMHRTYVKSDLFFNDEKKCNYEASKKQDLSFFVVDEIALEGLDGITLEAFWKRLRNVFPNYISKAVADRLWRMICNNKRINFYILQEPREKLIAFDRCKYMDIDSGVFVEPFIEFKDIYPSCSINGTEVRGSCSTYHTRKENNGVRRFSIEKVTKLYDQRLVFVADQVLRNKALINEETDPNVELKDLEYCMLERIGRSREQGELTQGKMSLHNHLSDKSVYHNRKVLAHNFLIVNQFFYVKSIASQQTISGGLVHLPRFYNKRKTKQIVIMEQIANLLREKPSYQIELKEFRKIFGSHRSIIKLLKTADFRRFFKTYTCPYRKIFPNATKSEYLLKSGCKERQVKIIRMIDPAANVTAIMEAKVNKETPFEQMKGDSSGHKLINYEYLRDIFLYILSTGRVGVTIQEIYDYFKMDFYSVRMAVRKLLLRNVIDSNKIDLGRQQSLKFYAKCFNNPNCVIDTQPKAYQLTQKTLSRVLRGYEKLDEDSVKFYAKPDPPPATTPLPTNFPLNFEPFGCTAFLTETVDPTEEQTIYDIVVKGRDKLLLIQSNLFAQYISEWDDFLLKREDFSKTARLFEGGFGKVIYDYLSTVRLNDNIQVDNCLVFNIDVITPDTKIGKICHDRRVIEIDMNFSNPHSSNCYIDSVGKIYLFDALFNEFHLTNQVVDKLRYVFDRLMCSEGKRKKDEAEAVKVEPKIEVEITNNVVMEKFMGPTPILLFSDTSEDCIKTEIFVSTEPTTFKEFGTMYITDDDNLTPRYINRANLILKKVYEETIVKDVASLFKDVRKEEDEEGYDKKVCKKSINSIVAKLVDEGYIKALKVVMTGKTTTRTQTFICVPFIDVGHSYIKSNIEQLKLKFYVGSQQNQKKAIVKVTKKTESPFSTADVKSSIVELKQMTSNKIDTNYKLNKNIGKVYGFCPKFVRMRVLHEYLFFVIRELTSSEQLSHKQVFDLFKNLKIKMPANEIATLPSAYRNEVSWKMFIPSLPPSNWPKGWALACDIVLRMPLSVFVKVYNVSYEIPELEAYLKHPIKRHFLLKNLPVNARNVLFHKRKYFHSIYETFSHLCYVGLLQMGPRNFKEKDQVFIYVNSKASLYDTCTSKPGYNQIENKKYKKIPFELKSGNDVEFYWSEMLRICMNTPLGKRKVLDGHCVTIEDCNSKPAMMETLKAKTFTKAVEDDNGRIPGDRRGGAGFDSSLWTFVKRNWVWGGQVVNKPSSNIQSQVTGLKKERFDASLPQPIQFDLLAKGGASERKVYLKPIKKMKKPSVQSIIIKKNSKKKLIRKIVAPKTKRVREYYDAVDKDIMRRNTQIRVDWDEEEEQLLRYCRAASVFLCPIFKKQFIPYNIIRDVLHRLYPRSRDKTSRAIQRRIYLLLMSDEIMKIMETNVENFLNSDTIAKYFDQIHNRYKYNIKITDSQVYISFIYLMSYIFRHRKEIELLLLGYVATVDFFSDPYIPLFEVILENVENENVTTIYTNPKAVEDVTKDTIKSVIHCSMACKKNSTGWAFQLFHIYKKFSDELIRVTVSDLKRGQFLVINKNYEEKNMANNWHTPLKLSHLYKVSKSSTYSNAVFLEAYQNFVGVLKRETTSNFMSCNELNSFWERTVFNFEIPEMGIILNPEIEDHSEVIEELAKRFRLYLVKIHERMTGSKSRNKDEIVPLEEKREHSNDVEINIDDIKTDVRHLIFRIPYLLEGNLELCFKKMLDCTSVLEINNYICSMIGELKEFAKDTSPVEDLMIFVDAIEDQGNIDDSKKLMKNLSKIVFAIQTIHQQDVCGSSSGSSYEDRFKFWETEKLEDGRSGNGEEAEAHISCFNKNYSSVMENCIKRAQVGDFPTLEEIKDGIMSEHEDPDNRQIPHITDLIMLLSEGRFPELDTDNEAIEKMKEHFIMQYPKLQEFFVEDLEELKTTSVVQYLNDDDKMNRIKRMAKCIVGEPQTDHIITYLNNEQQTVENVELINKVITFIKSKQELGANATDLKAKFSQETKLDLVDLLQYLVNIGVILRTGVCTLVYVHHDFKLEWLTNTFMLTPKEKEVFDAKEKQAMKKLKILIEERLESTGPLKVQLKPWTKLDGSLNSDIFHEWLCIILSHCINYPNIPFLSLSEHFHYIKPVDIFVLLEVLQELRCVKICLHENVESNILSTRCVISECQATCLDNFEDIFIKPTNVCGLMFGSFLSRDIIEIIL